MARFDQIKDMVMELEGDFDKFYNKGNSAAGTRVRKGMQDLKTLTQEIRLEVQNTKNATNEKKTRIIYQENLDRVITSIID